MRKLDKLVNFRIRSQVNHDIDWWVWHAANATSEIAKWCRKILEQRWYAVRPCIQALVDAKDLMTRFAKAAPYDARANVAWK